jgi:hypothetical protein
LDIFSMSGHELRRIEVLSEVLARRRTTVSAAAIIGLSTRQTRRLLAAYRDGGGGAMIHKARGRSSNNRLIPGIREYVIELVRSRYPDFGPSLAAEVLFEKDGVKVSRETLRQWMIEDGLWRSRKQRRSFHQPRLRRESYGELIQIDGSDHRWFEERGAACPLLVFIDDATGKLKRAGRPEYVWSDDLFEQTLKLTLAQSDAIERFELEPKIPLQRSTVTDVISINVLELSELRE